jgi:hypothetical protein
MLKRVSLNQDRKNQQARRTSVFTVGAERGEEDGVVFPTGKTTLHDLSPPP